MYTIALVGNTNVGKTSLFNFLTNSNFLKSCNEKYFTLDFSYNFLYNYKRSIILIDTCSFKKNDFLKLYLNKKKKVYKFFSLIEKKFIFILRNVNFIFFLIDARNISDSDIFYIRLLFKINKNIILILSKFDLYNNFFFNKNIFLNLGISKIFTSSIYNKNNFKKIFDIIFNNFSSNNINWFFIKKIIFCCINIENNIFYFKDYNNNYSKFNIIKLLILGKSNIGKSSLFNLFCNINRSFISSLDYTTKDFITYGFFYNKYNYFYLSDSPFIHKKIVNYDYIFDIIKYSFKIILYIVDINLGITKYDLWFLNFIFKCGKIVILIFNKCEKLNINYINKYKLFLLKKYDFIKYVDIYFLSSIKFKKKYFLKIYKNIFLNYKNIFLYKIDNNKLTKLLKLAIKSNIFNFNNFKLRYACIVKYYPLIIVIYGNKINLINNSYKKYLLNYYIKFLNIKGFKIFLKFKEIYKPFKYKK